MVVDTNVLVAALIHGGIVNRIVLSNPGSWAVPEHCLMEVWEHRNVWNRAGKSDETLSETLSEFASSSLLVYQESTYSTKLAESRGLVSDPDDAPVVAVALSIENEGVWTFNPADYAPGVKKGRIELLTTTRVASMYPPTELGT